MANVYLVKSVGNGKVVGLAVSNGEQWVGRPYGTNDGGVEPTTVADIEVAVESGKLPVPSPLAFVFMGLPQSELTTQFEDHFKEDVYYEHAMAV